MLDILSQGIEICKFGLYAEKGEEEVSVSPINGKLFVLAGAGGAGRALAFGAKSRGARVIIFDIDFGLYDFPSYIIEVSFPFFFPPHF